ncbi:MAG: PEP-CTERM sorting domain-containing protein [Candidatus Eisenbacteria bacterium]|nr:PEP-CTERM sorting domain-containing protein [Candidatus Eisenbacteria bacterium]
MKQLWFVLMLGTLLVAGQAGAMNLVTNGGFENPVVPPGSPYLIDVTPFGWTGTGDIAVQGYAGAVSSGDGNQWFDLNPGVGTGSGISQDVFLTAGTAYEFSFLFNGGGGGSTTEISYFLGSGSGTVLSGVVSTAGMDVYGGTLWRGLGATFIPPTSEVRTLRFLPNGAYSGGFIDKVELLEPSAAIPEPATLLLFGTALAGLAKSRRRGK